MIIWGSGSGHSHIGDAGSDQCVNCSAVRAFEFGINYRYAHIWYLFGWLTKKTYVRLCKTCGKGGEVTRTEALANGGKEQIPFFRRWGWGLLAALMVFIGFAAYAGYQEKQQHLIDYMAHPKLGDIYLLDLSKVPQQFQLNSHGLMKLVEINADSLTFVTATTAYSKLSGARRDLRNGAYAQSKYFDVDEKITMSISEIEKLRNSSAIDDIER